MSFLNNSTTAQRKRAVGPGHGRWVRPSVCRQLGQKKAALPALPGPDLRRKAHGAER